MINKIERVDDSFVDKINEVIDAVNEIMTWRFETDEDSDWYDDPKHREQPADNSEKANCQENVRLPYMQNKRLRKALGIAQSALVKLANDAYDMDEHIYIDKILNQIERITKGGDNE